MALNGRVRVSLGLFLGSRLLILAAGILLLFMAATSPDTGTRWMFGAMGFLGTVVALRDSGRAIIISRYQSRLKKKS
jgi:hypothetical protein